jgi:hypothetical protein
LLNGEGRIRTVNKSSGGVSAGGSRNNKPVVPSRGNLMITFKRDANGSLKVNYNFTDEQEAELTSDLESVKTEGPDSFEIGNSKDELRTVASSFGPKTALDR